MTGVFDKTALVVVFLKIEAEIFGELVFFEKAEDWLTLLRVSRRVTLGRSWEDCFLS